MPARARYVRWYCCCFWDPWSWRELPTPAETVEARVFYFLCCGRCLTFIGSSSAAAAAAAAAAFTVSALYVQIPLPLCVILPALSAQVTSTMFFTSESVFFFVASFKIYHIGTRCYFSRMSCVAGINIEESAQSQLDDTHYSFLFLMRC